MKTKMMGLLGALGLLATLLGGCGGTYESGVGPGDGAAVTGNKTQAAIAGDKAVPPTAQYMPLRVGAKWNYRFTNCLDGSGYNVTASSNRAVTKSGATWYEVAWWYDRDVRETICYRHDTAGLFAWINGQPATGFALKTPLQVNTAWTGAPWAYKIISTDCMTTGPMGTLRGCVRVDGTNGGITRKTWYAPNVGMYREEIWFGATRFGRTELTSLYLPR
ncbi:MAG: hypothetical protein WCP21_09250 [Armatimonadota bacterium]